MKKKFKILNEFKGLGDPSGKIWFFGIEWGKEWENSEALRKAITEFKNSEGFLTRKADWGPLNSSVHIVISKIISKFYEHISWKEYRDHFLFCKGGGIFQANLYPLKRKNTKTWTDDYEKWFGYGKKDIEKYISDVRNIRFRILKNFWQENSPLTTICFGKAFWSDFQDLLKLNDKPEIYEDGYIQVYKPKRVVLTPFFGYGHMSDSRINTLIKILRDISAMPKFRL